MYMLGIEDIICSMACQCVSAISALHSSIAALGFASGTISGFRSDIADTHLEAMLYILHIYIYIYIYIYIIIIIIIIIFVSLTRECIAYVVMEVATFLGDRSIMGVVCKRTHACQQEECNLQLISLTVVYSRETRILTQESLTSKYNKLLSFRHEEFVI